MNSEVQYCYRCGGRGTDDENGCPNCGRKKEKINLSTTKEEKVFIKNAQWKLIPNDYIGVLWNKDELLASHPECENNIKFQTYASVLEVIVNRFRKGVLFDKSLFIASPSGFSKEIFAYTCMQLALKNGMSVAPILDTVSIGRLLKLCVTNPNYKLYNFIDYDTYMCSQVCFVFVTNLPSHRWDLDFIKELLDRRSRLGFPTYVLSPFPLREISLESRLPYSAFLDSSQKHLGCKYPIVQEFFDGGDHNEESNKYSAS